ncbi:hypothetical protein pEaSNUABM46_00012 [Erwinia phage pEa_SNUABM_46]|nr:hypothetical protein pEaSNUABM45_00012 [Erwinia phage pEa_SNUABM_45]QYW03996.1 hypothetical protein pEaSNUABM46_00012 [Erwinia phage pEa_SNUABM_46]
MKHPQRVAHLEHWLEAGRAAFTMGVRTPNKDGVDLLAIFRAVSRGTKDQCAASIKKQTAELIEDIERDVPAFKVIRRRFRKEFYPDYNIPAEVELYVALLAETFGDIVQTMTYLHLRRCVDTKDLLLNWLPNGYPAKDAMGLLWNLQKVPTENEFMFTGNAVDCIQSVNDLYNKMYKTGDK